MTGFLVPADAPPAQKADDDADDDFAEVPETDGLAEENSEERVAAHKGFFPSSMGLSMLVGLSAGALSVIVRWGDYEPVAREHAAEEEDGEPKDPGKGDGDGAGGQRTVWRRTQREQHVEIPLGGPPGAREPQPVPDSGGLEVQALVRPLSSSALEGRLPDGTRSVSVFLINRRPPRSDEPDRAFAFQAGLELGCGQPFVPRPDLRAAGSDEWEEQVAELHYAGTPEYATGHGVSADWELTGEDCLVLRTRWIPCAEVEQTKPSAIPGVELSMDVLGTLADAPAATMALSPLVNRYREWIAREGERVARELTGRRRETADELLSGATHAADRIEHGIALLASDPQALDAFRIANRAVAAALRRRLADVSDPAWRPFQLAFILLNLPGVADPADPHRETVDLLFFPTGGGKTEAYLGLSAFAIILRRLRHPGDGGRAGAGVSVIMRYTLRLLTLDQLARAAGLMCALELERERDGDRYGTWPLEIGLWVGKAATPNVLGRKGDGRHDNARTKVRQFKNDSQNKPSPIPLENCPWCGERFAPESFTLRPDDDRPRELHVVCTNLDCDFNGESRSLPIVAVDEPLYRRLPAFLIATVDKFATLPWVGTSGALLGGADRYDADGFFAAAEPGKGTPLRAPLPPPDLVIQDELHLISGPLGTMAGLYETAIDALCSRPTDGLPMRPKIVASTATVRRAQEQVQALFGRSLTQVFPPPGPDRRDTFFAQTVSANAAPARSMSEWPPRGVTRRWSCAGFGSR